MRITANMHFKLKSWELKDKDGICNKNSNICDKDIYNYLLMHYQLL